MSEFIYVLENPSMPGLVKIGRTERSVSDRMSELSAHTGVPTDFVLVKEYAVINSVVAERRIHDRLAGCRVANNREFFKIEADAALSIIEVILGPPKSEKQRDFEREDELAARAIPIVVTQGIARPRMLENSLGISYEEALSVIHILRGRGVVDEHNQSRWTTNAKPQVIESTPKPTTVTTTPLIGNYQLPTMDFLQHPDFTGPTESKEEIMAKARRLQQTLAKFDIETSLGDITKGPTVTCYTFHLAPGISFEQVVNCSNQLADSLGVGRVRVTTPEDKLGCVIVEAPNLVKTKVIMRDLFESDEWRNSNARIPVALGKDIYGHPLIADLSQMPHLLIAGKIGAGKSLCLHAMIASLLYRFAPDQIRFVMIEPGGNVELQVYNALPHLIAPVVSDTAKAILVLRWVVNEMEKRFLIFARVGVSNISSFNTRPHKNAGGTQEDDITLPEKLSYVVVFIENLDGLMQSGGRTHKKHWTLSLAMDVRRVFTLF
jgi:DNA segregation ATPase FtsK/SpoIIIE-like protein